MLAPSSSSSSPPPPPPSSSPSVSVASPFCSKRPRIEPVSTIVVYDGSWTFWGHEKVTGFTVAAGVTTIFNSAFYHCPKLASLGVMREGVRVIGSSAFALCLLLTSLQGLPKSLTTICDNAFYSTGLTTLDGLPSTVTAIGYEAFAYCEALASIGPGFSPDCDVHPDAFEGCSALLAAAQAKGFATAIEWGKHHWLEVRRSTALAAVRRARPALPDVLVRVVMDFAGVRI